ncbi:hypothetical protein HCJ39_05195 [Listeria rocourtiae]|uniref:hypothetical protein n=1 Tax=Listeria rocourtiae TaxID=647910 RepID=UPI001626467D|nr:hypothetical protein [Listeria rocourtiae]MBC1604109.1 hypothetical protein [Listeria rocourtiae]
MNISEMLMSHPQFHTPKMKLSEKIIKIESEKGYSQEEAASVARIPLELFVQLELGREDIDIRIYMNTLSYLEDTENLYPLPSRTAAKQKSVQRVKISSKKLFFNNKFNRTAGTFL